MPPDVRRYSDWHWLGSTRPARFAALAWAILLVVTAIQVIVQPRAHSVFPIFENAGASWIRGESIYGDKRATHHLEFFRYSPTVAAFFAPFSAISLRAGGLIWRLGNAAVFLGGLAWWFRAMVPKGGQKAGKQLAWLLLLTLPLSAASLHNSQSNPLVLGLLLIATAAAAETRWTIAACAIVGATVFKVYPLALGLLFVIAFPRPFAGRLAIALILAAALPFLAQRPSYVLSQYVEWIHYLRSDTRHAVSIDYAYRDLRLPFRAWGISIDDQQYMLAQLAGAAAAAAACLAATLRNHPLQTRSALALGLATLWMTLLGPATESCTYMFVAPCLALGLIQARDERRRSAFALLGSAYLLFLADPASLAIPSGAILRNHGVLPLAGLLTLAGLVRLACERPSISESTVLPYEDGFVMNASQSRLDTHARRRAVSLRSAFPAGTSAPFQGSRQDV